MWTAKNSSSIEQKNLKKQEGRRKINLWSEKIGLKAWKQIKKNSKSKKRNFLCVFMCRGSIIRNSISLCVDVCEFCECDKGKNNIWRLSYCGWKEKKSCAGGKLRLFEGLNVKFYENLCWFLKYLRWKIFED